MGRRKIKNYQKLLKKSHRFKENIVNEQNELNQQIVDLQDEMINFRQFFKRQKKNYQDIVMLRYNKNELNANNVAEFEQKETENISNISKLQILDNKLKAHEETTETLLGELIIVNLRKKKLREKLEKLQTVSGEMNVSDIIKKWFFLKDLTESLRNDIKQLNEDKNILNAKNEELAKKLHHRLTNNIYIETHSEEEEEQNDNKKLLKSPKWRKVDKYQSKLYTKQVKLDKISTQNILKDKYFSQIIHFLVGLTYRLSVTVGDEERYFQTDKQSEIFLNKMLYSKAISLWMNLLQETLQTIQTQQPPKDREVLKYRQSLQSPSCNKHDLITNKKTKKSNKSNKITTKYHHKYSLYNKYKKPPLRRKSVSTRR